MEIKLEMRWELELFTKLSYVVLDRKCKRFKRMGEKVFEIPNLK